MSDGMKKAVLLLIAPDFPHQENRIQHQSGNDDAEEYDAED